MDATNGDIPPSQVTNVRFLFWPPASEDLDIEQGGKWMVFLNGEFEKLDVYWNALRSLCGENGILYKIRTTTAVDKEGGLITCYTRNAEDRSDVRKAAAAIVEATKMDKPICYKTNRATEEGQYRRLGKTNISKYKFTKDKKFFEKTGNEWTPVWRWRDPRMDDENPCNVSPEHDDEKNQTANELEETNDEASHFVVEEDIQSTSTTTTTSLNENVLIDSKPQVKKDTNGCSWRTAPRLEPNTDPSNYRSFSMGRNERSSRENADYGAIEEGIGNISLDTGLGVPSLEKKRMVLIYPKEDSVKNLYEDPIKAGKWMLFGSGDYNKMDIYWGQLKPLCDAGIIAALKTSTVMDKREGVIRAYTTDSYNKENVKEVAEKIFEATSYGRDLYYKTNESSCEGMYRHEGMSDISFYKHDKNIFYVKEGGQWRPWP